jgi:hypothetical protein
MENCPLFSQIGGSATPDRRHSLVPGKVVPILLSTWHTEAIARDRCGELRGARVTHSSFSLGSMEAELRRAVWISLSGTFSLL